MDLRHDTFFHPFTADKRYGCLVVVNGSICTENKPRKWSDHNDFTLGLNNPLWCCSSVYVPVVPFDALNVKETSLWLWACSVGMYCTTMFTIDYLCQQQLFY